VELVHAAPDDGGRPVSNTDTPTITIYDCSINSPPSTSQQLVHDPDREPQRVQRNPFPGAMEHRVVVVGPVAAAAG
jgi:hypothetical protein